MNGGKGGKEDASDGAVDDVHAEAWEMTTFLVEGKVLDCEQFADNHGGHVVG